MGRPNAEQSDQAVTYSHFSHPHPLQLINTQDLPTISICSACKLEASGSVYSCTPCNFFLHQKCYGLPQKIKHEFDQNHILSLQPKPVYPEGLFNCDACGHTGDGFSYHCSPCKTDLHALCACLPMSFTHHSHQHPLSLTFSAPYPGNAFSCDICRKIGTKTWLYRCSNVTCEFDVHLTCVATIIPPVSRFTASSRPIPPFSHPPSFQGHYVPLTPRPPPVAVGPPPNQFIATQYPPNPMPYNNTSQRPPNYGPTGPANVGLTGQILGGAANGLASGIAQATTQALIQGFTGGGSGGGGGAGAGAGGNASQVDSTGGGGNVMIDGGSYYDSGQGGIDGGYSGGDGSYSNY